MFRSNSMINSNCVRESSPLTVLSGLPRVEHQIYKHKQPRSLRAVPTIVIAYVLRISRYSGFPIGDAYKYSNIFARFKTIRTK